jgi:phosphate transport system permease protein
MTKRNAHIGSLIVRAVVFAAAAVTVFVLASLVVYILVKGVPSLTPSMFAWKYTSDNCSMMPAIINTITVTLIALAISVPLGVFSAIYLAEYAKR